MLRAPSMRFFVSAYFVASAFVVIAGALAAVEGAAWLIGAGSGLNPSFDAPPPPSMVVALMSIPGMLLAGSLPGFLKALGDPVLLAICGAVAWLGFAGTFGGVVAGFVGIWNVLKFRKVKKGC